MNRVVVLIVALLAVTALILWVAGGAAPAFGTDQSAASFTYNIVLLVLLLSALVLGWRGTASQAVRYALIWIALGFALVLGYSYRNDVKAIWQRVTGEVNPALPVERGGGQVVLRRADDGHFYADVAVNGKSIRMLVDTGASAIALSAEDAARAGIDVDGLAFVHVVSTANGETAAAEVRLDDVRVGSIARRNVRAMVTRGLSGSLLGMSFLDKLTKYTSEADEMVLQD
jgi:aspartyl protease family protein